MYSDNICVIISLIHIIQLSLIAEPLLNSFNSSVSTSSYEEMYRTTLQWVDQHCTLGDLRPSECSRQIRLNELGQLVML